MAKPKQNIQWAPGTRPQRMNREDGQWEYEMQLLKNKKAEEERPKKEQIFHQGEMVWFFGDIVCLGKVDPDGYWVECRNAKVGVECFKKLPQWFEDEYDRLANELEPASGTV